MFLAPLIAGRSIPGTGSGKLTWNGNAVYKSMSTGNYGVIEGSIVRHIFDGDLVEMFLWETGVACDDPVAFLG